MALVSSTQLAKALGAIDDGDFGRAITLLTDLLASASGNGDVALVTRVARELAAVFSHDGDPQEGVEVLTSTRAWLVDQGASPVRLATFDVALSSAYRAAQQSHVALELLAQAEEVLRNLVPELVVATLHHDRAVLLSDLGQLDDAISGFVAAREVFLGSRDRLGVAAVDHNLGCALHDFGNFDDAVEYFQEARSIFLALHRAEEAAACDQNLGVVFFDLHRYEESGRRFAVARHRFDEIGARHSAGECDYNLGVLLEIMGREDEAARYRARAALAGVNAPVEMGLSGQVPVVSPTAVSRTRGATSTAPH